MRPESKEARFYSEKQLQEIADDIDRAITIPVNSMIDMDHRVFDLSEVEKILRKAKRITVQDCGCKTENGNCDAPREVCIGLDEEADYTLEQGILNVREIEIDEALDVLRRSHEAGLVHMAYVFKDKDGPGLICSCCSCCCHTLGGLLRYGIHTKVLSSKLIALDDEKCIDCGKCVSRCVFKARWLNQNKLVYDESKCMGCGLCVSTCPTEAVSMVPRDQ